MGEPKQGKHFILVHGACHGAWCWYKLKPLLETAGHRVTALDMAASGIDLRRIQEVQTLRDYTEPLLDLLGSMGPDRDKVILVGHSLGGLNLGLAMELFPEKIDVAVFVTAFMLDSVHQPSYVLEQYGARGPEGGWLDTEFKCEGDPEDSLTTMFFGPLFLSQLYHLSPVEDFELAMALKRPSSLFLRDLKKAKKFTKERYDSVRRTYVICNEDKGIPEAFQQWMIDNNGSVDEVKKINGSDHMPMLCLPQNLCACLLEIAEKYA